MNQSPATANEKPLRGFSKLALFSVAGAIILLSYVFSAASVLFLLVLIACEFLLFVALLRFGLAGFIAGVMAEHIALLTVFLRSFWLKKGVDYHISLVPQEAPGLFTMLQQSCLRARVNVPAKVSLEMTVNAWVQLKGYRRGTGRTVLGIGYDLMAGMSQSEVEAVLAHEMMHAKLVQRGLKRILNTGLWRMGQLVRALSARVDAYRRIKKSGELPQFFLNMTDRLTRLGAKQVAACSRQDEFDADRGAAEICSPGAVRSALVKLEPLNKAASRLPWNERIARLQSGDGFSRWLMQEFASTAFDHTAGAPANLFYKYSTHPSLQDRLAALPPISAETPMDSKPGLELLAEPDQVAEKLISEIQRVAALQEQEDTKRLRRWTRKTQARTHLRPIQSIGILLMTIGGIGGIITWLTLGMSLGLAAFILIFCLAGYLCIRFGWYRERLALAVPDFSLLKSAWESKLDCSEEKIKKIEAELQARFAGAKNGRKKVLALASESYDALSDCDYLRAHIAARLCLQIDEKSVEGALGLAVASAALGQVSQVHQVLNFLQRLTGIRDGSMAWGVAWALILCADWTPAEAFLENARKRRAENRTLLILLALCQSQRGKLQSAILSARQACTPETTNKDHSQFLINLLLRAGYLREARERLQKLEPQLREDAELTLLMIRLHLLSRDFKAAEDWTAVLKKSQCAHSVWIRVGEAYELARETDKAAAFYNEVLSAGYYPAALVGLGRLAAERQNKSEAREHLLGALDMIRPVGEGGQGPLALFQAILSLFLSLEEPVENCRAWISRLDARFVPAEFANQSFLIYAPSRPQAEQFLRIVFNGMQPGTPPPIGTTITWSEAPKEQQPDVPVRPGVQGVLP